MRYVKAIAAGVALYLCSPAALLLAAVYGAAAPLGDRARPPGRRWLAAVGGFLGAPLALAALLAPFHAAFLLLLVTFGRTLIDLSGRSALHLPVAGLGLVLGIYGIRMALALRYELRALDRLKISPIADAGPGLREFEGIARLARNPAPTEGTEAHHAQGLPPPPAEAIFSLCRETRTLPGRGRSGARVSLRWTARSFELEDGSGRIRVNPVGARIWEGSGSPFWERFCKVLLTRRRSRVELPDEDGSRETRMLLDGDRVHLVGWVERDAEGWIVRLSDRVRQEPRFPASHEFSMDCQYGFAAQSVRFLWGRARRWLEGEHPRDLFILSDAPEFRIRSHYIRAIREAGMAAAIWILLPLWLVLHSFRSLPEPVLAGAAPPPAASADPAGGLLQGLHSPVPAVRLRALEALSLHPDFSPAQRVDGYRLALRRNDRDGAFEDVRFAAARKLAQMRDSKARAALSDLAEAARKDASPRVRDQAFRALYSIEPEGHAGRPILMERLGSADPGQRETTLRLLCDSRWRPFRLHAEEAGGIGRLAADPSAGVRREAFRVLEQSHPTSIAWAGLPLARALREARDPEAWRDSAPFFESCSSLLELAVPEVAAAVRDSSPAIRLAVLGVLGRLGPRARAAASAVGEVESVAPSAEEREAARLALARMQAPAPQGGPSTAPSGIRPVPMRSLRRGWMTEAPSIREPQVIPIRTPEEFDQVSPLLGLSGAAARSYRPLLGAHVFLLVTGGVTESKGRSYYVGSIHRKADGSGLSLTVAPGALSATSPGATEYPWTLVSVLASEAGPVVECLDPRRRPWPAVIQPSFRKP